MTNTINQEPFNRTGRSLNIGDRLYSSAVEQVCKVEIVPGNDISYRYEGSEEPTLIYLGIDYNAGLFDFDYMSIHNTLEEAYRASIESTRKYYKNKIDHCSYNQEELSALERELMWH